MELALVLPLVVVLLLIVVQVALVARDQVLVVHAAREGARAAAVERREDAATAARNAVRNGSDLKTAQVRVETSYGSTNDYVRVTVHMKSRTALPVVGRLFPDVALTAKATMRSEVGQEPERKPVAGQKYSRTRVIAERNQRQQHQ